jgi:outer membrane protein TolC
MFPELDITGSYGHGASGGNVREFSDAFNDFRTGDRPFWTVGGTFSIPLSNKAARNRYKQSKLTADQLVLQLKKLEESALVQIDETVNQVRTSLDRVDSTRKARTYAEDALDAEQKKLASGKSTSFVVLQLQRDLTSARSEEIRALADYNQALSRLALEEGTTLERKKIRVDVK